MVRLKNFSILSAARIFLLTCLLWGVSFIADARDYEVGPRREYASLSKVPFDELNPGDVVKIHYRSNPYRERIILRRSGSLKQPIVITGVPGSGGRLPVIDGKMARQFQKENWPTSGRWLIKIGDGTPGDHVEIRNLILRNANNANQTVEENGQVNYLYNAAGVFLRSGKNVLISNCRIYSNGNGLLTYHAPDVSQLKIRRCTIYQNGDRINPKIGRAHNLYLQGAHSIVEFCHFHSPYGGGQNIKDRGYKTIIRYNWIESGWSRQLDFVENKRYQRAHAFVYGNVIIQGGDARNENIVHWGGDSGHSRSGTLFFFNNTVIGYHPLARYFDVNYPDCRVDIRNNAFVGQGKLWNRVGSLYGKNNWFSSGIIYPQERLLGVSGINPWFLKNFAIPYYPCLGSSLINSGAFDTPLPVKYMPFPNGRGIKRHRHQLMDIGAYEYSPSLIERLSK